MTEVLESNFTPFHSLGRVACLKAETYLAKKSDPAAATTALDGLLSGLAVVAEKAAPLLLLPTPLEPILQDKQ